MSGLSRRPVPDGGATVEVYLAAIGGRLPGPGWAHAGILAELRSGLLDATEAHQAAGLPSAEAAAAAIGEFGDPVQVADAFRGEIAGRQARAVAISLLAAGPLIGLLWFTAALTSHLGVRLAPPWQWQHLSVAARAAVHLFVIPIGVTAWAALFAIASTGRLSRWLPVGPRGAPTAAAVAGLAAACGDALGLALIAIQLATAGGQLAPLPVAAAAAASLTRLVLARRAAHRCLAVRASLA